MKLWRIPKGRIIAYVRGPGYTDSLGMVVGFRDGIYVVRWLARRSQPKANGETSFIQHHSEAVMSEYLPIKTRAQLAELAFTGKIDSDIPEDWITSLD